MRRPWIVTPVLAVLFLFADRPVHAQVVPPAAPAPTGASAATPASAAAPASTAVPVATAAPAATASPDRRLADPRGAPLALGDVATIRFKPGTGAVITSADDRFSLKVRTRIQLRYDLDVPHDDGEAAQHTFQVRRMRLVFTGHAFGEHNKFYLQLGLSPRDQLGGLLGEEPQIRYNPVRDARVELDHLRDLTVHLGQMKVPFSRQRVISSGNLEMVDRSLVNEEFQLDRDLGVHVLSKDLFGWNRLTYSLGVFLGEGRNAFEATDFGVLWVARAEWLPFGKFDDYTEGDLARSARPGLSVGVAYAFHDNARGMRSVHGDGPADGGTTDYHHVTADVMFKHRGLSAQIAFHHRDGVRAPGDAVDETGVPVPPDLPRSGVGLLAQIGYLLPWLDLQAVGRYATVHTTDRAASSLSPRTEVGVGLGYYFGAHAYKIQVDYCRLWNDGAIQTGADRVRAHLQLSL